jgi:hypothetical protein
MLGAWSSPLMLLPTMCRCYRRQHRSERMELGFDAAPHDVPLLSDDGMNLQCDAAPCGDLTW